MFPARVVPPPARGQSPRSASSPAPTPAEVIGTIVASQKAPATAIPGTAPDKNLSRGLWALWAGLRLLPIMDPPPSGCHPEANPAAGHPVQVECQTNSGRPRFRSAAGAAAHRGA